MAVPGLRVVSRAAVVNSVAIFSFHFLFRVFVSVPSCCRHASLSCRHAKPELRWKSPICWGLALGLPSQLAVGRPAGSHPCSAAGHRRSLSRPVELQALRFSEFTAIGQLAGRTAVTPAVAEQASGVAGVLLFTVVKC